MHPQPNSIGQLQHLLHLHHQQLQVQQAMALAAAQNGNAGAGAGAGLGPPSGSHTTLPNNGGAGLGGGLGNLGSHLDGSKHGGGGPLDFGGLPSLGRFGLPQSSPSGPAQALQSLQRPPSAAGRALAGALAGTGLMGMGLGGAGPGSMANLGGGPGNGLSGTGPEEITTVFIVGFPDDMTERELNNMFLFARGFEAATLKIPPAINNHAAAGGPYNFVNLQGPATSGMDPSFGQGGPGGFGDADGFASPFGGPNAANMGPKNLKNIIGFAKFRTRADALAARDALNGRKIDAERGCVVKTEMAKKNLHTKQRAPGLGGGGTGTGSGPSGTSGPSAASLPFGALASYGAGGNDFGPMGPGLQGADRGPRPPDGVLGGAPNHFSQFTSPNVGGPSDFDPWPLNPAHDHHQQRGGGREVPTSPADLRSPMSPNNFATFPSGPQGFGRFGGSNNTSPPNAPGRSSLESNEQRNRSPPAALDMDSVTNLEEGSFQRGFGGGHDHGRLHGTFEGRSLGREKGFEIWDEVGYYEGVAQFWHTALEQASADPSTNSRRLGRQRLNLNELQKLISAFSQTNRSSQEGAEGSARRGSPSHQSSDKPEDPLKDPSSMDIIDLLEHIRARFKITASLLGIPAQHQPQPPTGVESGPNQGRPAPPTGRPHQLSGGLIVDTQQLGF
ncbi:hypothetical protein V8E36_001256 [Tilletia maclaganii]